MTRMGHFPRDIPELRPDPAVDGVAAQACSETTAHREGEGENESDG